MYHLKMTCHDTKNNAGPQVTQALWYVCEMEKLKILVCIFYKNFWAKNKGTILLLIIFI